MSNFAFKATCVDIKCVPVKRASLNVEPCHHVYHRCFSGVTERAALRLADI